MKPCWFFFLLLTGLLFATTVLFSQNKAIVDSLKRIDTRDLPVDQRIKVFVGLAEESSRPEDIITYANEVVRLCEGEDYPQDLARGYLALAQAHKLLGNLDKALKFCYLSLEIYTRTNNIKNIAVVDNTISTIYLEQKNYPSAIEFLKKSLAVNRSLKNSMNLAGDYNNLGEIFRLKGELDTALFYFNKAYEIFYEQNVEIGVAYTLGNAGLVYAEQGNYTQAENKMDSATSILKDLGDYYPISVFYIALADMYQAKGDYTEALFYAKESLEMAAESSLKEQIRDASLKLSELYSENGEFEKAYHFHTRYVNYRDSINNEEVYRKMANLRTEYEISQKQAEIDLLHQKRQITRITGFALLLILLLLTALAFLLYRNNRHKKATNKILQAQNAELEAQHHKLERLNHTKDRFFSIISHDLRGPVNAFNGVSELIKHYISRNEMRSLREVSEYIDQSARQLSTLLDNLLDWSVKQQEAFPYHPEKVSLGKLLAEIVEMFQITAFSKKINLSLKMEEEIDLWGDRNSLHTIFRNLINNALKFTEANGLVSISAYTENEYAYINIMDTGIGIAEEKLDTLFELKEKRASQGTSGEKGLGIGLSLSYEFAAMNRGTILVNSEENAGTIFTVKIPLFEHRESLEEQEKETLRL